MTKASRRNFILSLSAAPLFANKAFASNYSVFAQGLTIPESPIIDTDGSLIITEIVAKRITRLKGDGSKIKIAELNDALPVAIAAGPDGAIYIVCAGVAEAGNPNGSLRRLDPNTKEISVLATQLEDGTPLYIPDDLVFDAHGGFYFTDVSNIDMHSRVLNQTGIYYFDGTKAKLVSERGAITNGIGMSPDGQYLYWTQYLTSRLFKRKILAPGVLETPVSTFADCIYSHPAPITLFDSMRVDAEGIINVAVHDRTINGKAGIMSFRPDGRVLSFTRIQDEATSSIALSWDGRKKAYVTLSHAGKVVELPWPRYGQKPLYLPSPNFR